eukprot:1177826-Prorocentrum_minimum.AAC.3
MASKFKKQQRQKRFSEAGIFVTQAYLERVESLQGEGTSNLANRVGCRCQAMRNSNPSAIASRPDAGNGHKGKQRKSSSASIAHRIFDEISLDITARYFRLVGSDVVNGSAPLVKHSNISRQPSVSRQRFVVSLHAFVGRRFDIKSRSMY